MPQLLIVLAAAVVFFWAVGKYGKGNPAFVRQVGGIILMALAGFIALRGGAAVGAPLFILGLGLLGRNFPFSNWDFNWGRRSEGQKSSVRTRMLSMELDHDTGSMDGEVLAGRFAGKRLQSMSLEQLLRLLEECHDADGQSANLLEAYLDRAHAGWRSKSGSRKTAAGGRPGAMSKEEAYAVLGDSP